MQRGALDVVVDDGRGELGMRGAVAGFALQAAVALGEAVERKPGCGRVHVGGKRLVGGGAHGYASGEHGGEGDLPAIGGRGPRVALLAGRFVEPSVPRGDGQCAHCAVAALAFNGVGPGAGREVRHGPAQALGHGPGMAVVAGFARAGVFHGLTGGRVGGRGMEAVHRRGQRRHSGVARQREGVRAVAGGAQERLDGGLRFEPRGAVAPRRRGRQEHAVGFETVVVFS